MSAVQVLSKQRLRHHEIAAKHGGDAFDELEMVHEFQKQPRIRGVMLPLDGCIPADLVVCNADAPMVYSKLIDPKYRKGVGPTQRISKIAPQKYSMGLFVMYFGTKKTTYPDVAHHAIVLGKQYKELIDDLFDRFGLETDDTSVYLHRPTATDPAWPRPAARVFTCSCRCRTISRSRANGGAERHDRRADAGRGWLDRLGRDGTDHARRDGEVPRPTVLPKLSETIVDDFYVTPDHFEKNLNSMHGARLQHPADLLAERQWFRFHNKAPGIEGLSLSARERIPARACRACSAARRCWSI